MNAPTLSPCPFCGSTMQTKTGMDCWYAHCTSCQAEGPIRDTEAEAIAASNRRAGAAVPPDLLDALKAAATSLETLSFLSGRETYGKPPIKSYMGTFPEVREFAASRARVARAAIAAAELVSAAPAATGPTPTGYVMVPVEPTPEMLDAAGHAYAYPSSHPTPSEQGKRTGERIYKAMLSAATGSPPGAYEGRAEVNGEWLPWHPITKEVFDNRQRWPRDGYEVRAAMSASTTQTQEPSNG